MRPITSRRAAAAPGIDTGTFREPQNGYDLAAERGPAEFDISTSLRGELRVGAAVRPRAAVRQQLERGDRHPARRLAAQWHPRAAERPGADGDARRVVRAEPGRRTSRPAESGRRPGASRRRSARFSGGSTPTPSPRSTRRRRRSATRASASCAGPATRTSTSRCAKDFRVDDRRRFQFRTEVFNAFNRANFGPPNIQRESSGFGQILTAEQRAHRPVRVEVLLLSMERRRCTTAPIAGHCARCAGEPGRMRAGRRRVQCGQSQEPPVGRDERSAADGAPSRRGVEFHNQRRLDEASREYARALSLDPPRPPSAAELTRSSGASPRACTRRRRSSFRSRTSPAVLHPTERLIAYHLFWEDDIDFPDDNDPCDHEVVWVQFARDGRSIERFWTYFHGRILEGGEAALRDAREHGMRPRVNVQWGKHGSMPHGWEPMPIVADERRHRAAVPVRRDADLAARLQPRHVAEAADGGPPADRSSAGAPARLARSVRWRAGNSSSTSRASSIRLALIDRHRMVSVSRWNSAVINQQFLAYNFRPKTEWPTEARGRRVTSDGAVGGRWSRRRRSTISSCRRRRSSTRRCRDIRTSGSTWTRRSSDSYEAAVRLVADQVRGPMRLRESHGPFSNPEGADFEVTLEHLQPWEVAEHRALQHAHAFHMRVLPFGALGARSSSA